MSSIDLIAALIPAPQQPAKKAQVLPGAKPVVAEPRDFSAHLSADDTKPQVDQNADDRTPVGDVPQDDMPDKFCNDSCATDAAGKNDSADSSQDTNDAQASQPSSVADNSQQIIVSNALASVLVSAQVNVQADAEQQPVSFSPLSPIAPGAVDAGLAQDVAAAPLSLISLSPISSLPVAQAEGVAPTANASAEDGAAAPALSAFAQDLIQDPVPDLLQNPGAPAAAPQNALSSVSQKNAGASIAQATGQVPVQVTVKTSEAQVQAAPQIVAQLVAVQAANSDQADPDAPVTDPATAADPSIAAASANSKVKISAETKPDTAAPDNFAEIPAAQVQTQAPEQKSLGPGKPKNLVAQNGEIDAAKTPVDPADKDMPAVKTDGPSPAVQLVKTDAPVATAHQPAHPQVPPQAILHAHAAPHVQMQQVLRAPMAMERVPFEIAIAAHRGEKEFEIRLDPPELGRVDVSMSVDKSGKVATHLIVERSETLDQLRKDAPNLERALQNSGLKTDSNSLQFSLRDQNAQNFSGGQHDGFARRNIPKIDLGELNGWAAPRMAALDAGRGAGLDMRI